MSLISGLGYYSIFDEIIKMRTTLFFAFIATLFQFTNKINSQTLQFSRVLLVSTTQTVPANKVWKVETYISDQISSSYYMVINSHNSGFNQRQPPLPLWLPAGTTLAAGGNIFRVSVIEFTVVP